MIITKTNGILLPNMILRRHHHSSVTIGNKLFMIGGNNVKFSEVYDSISRKFTIFSLEPPCASFNDIQCKTVNFNNKIVIFCKSNTTIKIYVYNVDRKTWIIKDKTLEYNFDEADFQIVPKQ